MARDKSWGDRIIVSGDCIGEDDAILLTLGGGGIARLGKSMRDQVGKGPTSLKVYGGGLTTSVEVSLTASCDYGRLCRAPHILAPLTASIACILIAVYSIILVLLYQHPIRNMFTVVVLALWLASVVSTSPHTPTFPLSVLFHMCIYRCCLTQ